MTSSTLLRRLGPALVVAVLAAGTACSSGDNSANGAPPTSAATPATGSGSSTAGAPSAASSAAISGSTTIPLLTAPTATTSANPNLITIQNFSYQGIDAARANVTWSITNKDNIAHTVSADDRSFVWRVEPGQTTAFFKTLAPGSYPIHCDIHPDLMKGVLVVS
jgi:Cupredoxin-like domain